jgi:polyferredoxin
MSAIVGLFTVFWLILPLLTKKKLWCNAICPLGAFVGLFGMLSPFQVRIDKEKCKACMLCTRVCKDYAMTVDRVKGSEKAAFECTKCGRCIDSCPQGAIDVHLRGTSRRVRSWFIPISLFFTFAWLSVFVWAIITILPPMLGFKT